MLDAQAILKAYPDVNQVTETQAFKQGCVDVTSTLDQAKIDAARVELNKLNYKLQRAEEYPDWGTQLDYIYHNGIDKWKTDIVDPVKTKYPKPS
jgi:hypothetical protein|tara:strand:+ start:301 stop:582 length:282 start_codon:yes stop_codon:yes gene_type:complete